MDLALLVYGISVVANINTPLVVGTVVLGILTAVLLVMKMAHVTPSSYDKQYNMEGHNAFKAAVDKWFKVSIIVLAVVAFLNAITPSEKTMYIMVGAYAAQKVAENEKVATMSSKVLKIIESKLDGYIDDAEQEVKKKLEAEAKKTINLKDEKKNNG